VCAGDEGVNNGAVVACGSAPALIGITGGFGGSFEQ
jgi:hypothetical protein